MFATVIVYIMAAFALLGGIDRIFGSRLGLGEEFEKGILTSGQLILTMSGIMVLAPVIADVLIPVVGPLYTLIGADPAVFAGSILACDMGGEAIAAALSDNRDAVALGGIITSSMLGVTISFTIPAAMSMTKKEDSTFVAKGILCGILTVPIGVLFGGLIAGFDFLFILKNLIPILLLSLVIAIGILKFENITVKIFNIFGKLITAVAVFGLLLGVFDSLVGFKLISGIAPVSDSFVVIGNIVLMLAGAFPLMALLKKLLTKPLQSLSEKLGIDSVSTLGLLATTVNSLIVFKDIEKMDPRGKTVNMAFAVSGAFVFGDHLAFCIGVQPDMILPMICGKLIAGAGAVAVAFLITRKDSSHRKSTEINA